MRSGFGFGDMRSRFDLVGVEIAIGFWIWGIGDRALIWLGLEMRSIFVWGIGDLVNQV